MMSSTAESRLNAAMEGLEKLKVPSIDHIIDLLIAVAVESGRLECVGHEELHFVIGKNDRKSFRFDDCVGRFRSVLARLHSRCKAAYPNRFEGNVYGFEADVALTYGESECTRLLVRTINKQAFPELVIETIETGSTGSWGPGVSL
jgi:hypothetical protein